MIRVDFWYEFASTYSYPAAMRISALAEARGLELRWRPFLLGPIFAGQGWRDSPFNLYPAKGNYMWRDVERICAKLRLPLKRPDPFPQNSLLAARVASALDEAARPAFTRAVYQAQYGEGRSISDRVVMTRILTDLGHHAGEALERAAAPEIKQKLRRENDEALRLGIFGAPTCVTEDSEIFWGNDRLEDALDWAEGRR
jgi:2-hydroxychromene-2-carboxylate isomerase